MFPPAPPGRIDQVDVPQSGNVRENEPDDTDQGRSPRAGRTSYQQMQRDTVDTENMSSSSDTDESDDESKDTIVPAQPYPLPNTANAIGNGHARQYNYVHNPQPQVPETQQDSRLERHSRYPIPIPFYQSVFSLLNSHFYTCYFRRYTNIHCTHVQLHLEKVFTCTSNNLLMQPTLLFIMYMLYSIYLHLNFSLPRIKLVYWERALSILKYTYIILTENFIIILHVNIYYVHVHVQYT